MFVDSVRRSERSRPNSSDPLEDRGKGAAFVDDPASVSDLLDSPRRGSRCLEKIYPRNDEETSDLDGMRMIDRVADVFMSSLGSRESVKMSSSAFRIFCRQDSNSYRYIRMMVCCRP